MVPLEELEAILNDVRTIAVVGASRDEDKAAGSIPSYLASQGYRVIPVNPHADELFGQRVYRSLHDIDVGVDMVDVFRPAAEAKQVAADAIAIGAKVLWFQPGTATEEAVEMASAAGLRVVADACAGVVHRLIHHAVVR